MRYIGLGASPATVTLHDGRWAGSPAAAGAASGAVVTLDTEFRLAGDLDGDGVDDAVVLLTHSNGGTATWSYLAVVARAAGALRNVATVALGDRVQIRSAHIADGMLSVSTVRAGPNDAACCPGELGEQQWALVGGRLVAQGNFTAGRLALTTLAGRTWVLRAWDVGEPAPVQPVVTLMHTGGAFTGRSGCNRYSAGVTPGAMPGELSVGIGCGHADGVPGRRVGGRGPVSAAVAQRATLRLQVRAPGHFDGWRRRSRQDAAVRGQRSSGGTVGALARPVWLPIYLAIDFSAVCSGTAPGLLTLCLMRMSAGDAGLP